MLSKLFVALLATASAALAAPVTEKRDATSNLITQLMQANGAVARNQILAAAGNQTFAFDYNNPPSSAVVSSPAGKLVSANSQTFPPLIGFDISLAFATVQPCGLILPHLHPRAEEFLFVTEGEFFTQFISETGGVLITNELKTNEGTMFPRGSIHLEYNDCCTPAAFVAAFNSNDPGVSFIAPNFFSLDDQVLLASLGVDAVISGQDLETIRHAIPADLATSVQQCLQKCNIKPNSKRSLAEVFAKV